MKLSRVYSAQIVALLTPICGLAFAACGGSSDSPANPSGASGAAATPSAGAGGGSSGDPSKLAGSFQVKLTPASSLGAATTSVAGKIYDGPTPVTTIWENPQVDGDCTLTTPRLPFCSTPCGGTAACVEDDTCLAYPTAQSAGTVTITGLKTTNGSTPLQLTEISNTYQAPPQHPLAYPPFVESDDVTLATAGDYFPAFNLSSKSIAALALTSTELALKSGQPLSLAWIKGGEGSANIHVKLDISHHGGSKGQIECDTADSGALTVSAALITKLVNLGVAGFPSVTVTRHTIGSTVIAPGRVELEISSSVEQAITIDGLNSCTDTTDCPEGQVCQPDLTCK